MDNKTKKILSGAVIVLIVVMAVTVLYVFSNSKDLEYKVGTYFYKMYIINEHDTKVFKWDLGIAKDNIKSSIIENKSNGEVIDKFKNCVHGIAMKRFEVFSSIMYFIFILIVFVCAQKDSKILKNESSKKFLQIFIGLIISVVIHKIIICFAQLNVLYKDINFYFSLIS